MITGTTKLPAMLLLRSAPRSAARRFAVGLLLPAVLLLSGAFAVLLVAPVAQADFNPNRTKILPGFNGAVIAISEPDSNGVRYVGGSFTAFDAVDSGGSALVDSTKGVVNRSFPKVTGEVNAVAPDGSGGYYIGGLFTAVDGTTRNNAAHILSDGSLDTSWDPNMNYTVNEVAVSDSVVYLGGQFTTVGGIARNYAAAVGTDGTLQSWDPNMSNSVWALAVSGSNVYLGGSFRTVGGTTRNYAAAVSTSATGNGSGGSCLSAYANACLQTWDPNMNNTVSALEVSDSNVYLGGYFTTVGGTTRNRAAAVDTDGTLQSWNPNMNNSVTALAVSGSNVYLGGTFTTVGGTTRNRAAAVSTSATGNGSNGSCLSAYANACLQTWDPNMNNTVSALAVSDSNVYLGGQFTMVGGTTRNRAAAVGTDGTVQSWNPNMNNNVNAIAVSGSTVYLGGGFTTVGGSTTRNRAAAVSTSATGNGSGGSCLSAYAIACLQTWDPNLNLTVWALAVSGSNVYLGGQFTTVGGTTRNRAAAVGTDGTLQSWNPSMSSGQVNAVAVSDSNVYLGGSFRTVGGTTRNYAAAVSTSATGNGSNGSCLSAYAIACLQSWDPNMGSNVNAVAVSDSVVYLGGQFRTVGGTTRNRAAAVSTSATGNGSNGSCLSAYADACLQSWDPNMDFTVSAIPVSGSTAYLGGPFQTVGGTTRNYAAAVSTSATGNGINGSCLSAYADACLQSWNPNVNSTVRAVAVSDSNVYLGGSFTNVGGTTRNYAAAVGTSGTLGSPWPEVTGGAPVSLDSSSPTVNRGTLVKGSVNVDDQMRSTVGAYAWQRCSVLNDASSCSDISSSSSAGTTGAWWGSRNADIGQQVRLKATWATIDSVVASYSALTGLFSPTSTVAPSINQGLVSGAPKVGTSLKSTFGTWNGYRAGLTSVTFQWQRCTTIDASSCTTNVGTNSQWYKPVAGDVGNYLRVTATLTTGGVGAGGGTQVSATASSTLSGPVASNLSARRMTARTAVSKPKVTRKAAKWQAGKVKNHR